MAKRVLPKLTKAESDFIDEKANEIEVRKKLALEVKGNLFIEDIHDLQADTLRNLKEALNSANENIRVHTAIKIAPYLFVTKKEVTHTHRSIDDWIKEVSAAEFKEIDDTGNTDTPRES